MMETCLKISGMNCHSCAHHIETALKTVPGVESAAVNFATEKATVHTSLHIDPKELVSAVRSVGYEAQLIDDTHQHHMHPSDDGSFLRLIIAIAATLPFLIEMIAMAFGSKLGLPPYVQLILATIVQFYCGWNFYRASYYSARSGNLNMDVLIVLGTSAAYFYSLYALFSNHSEHLYFETGAAIITLVLFGRWLESKSKGRASEAIAKLAKIQPKFAKVEVNGKTIDKPIEEIKVGDIILVRSGERIPVDAIVLDGSSEVDESMVTGESVPVMKNKGNKVLAGTMNQVGSLKIRAEEVGTHTVLSSIVRLVEHAQESKAPVQRLADKVAGIFIPFVLMVSAITFLGWWMFGNTISDALIKAVAVLVIACPCALGLATPIVIVAASGRGARSGIIFKEASAIETAHKIDTLCFDKTGTITVGKPVVTDIIPVGNANEKEVLKIAVALENHVQHPLSKAIVEAASQYSLPVDSVRGFQYIPGKGIIGYIHDIPCGVGTEVLAEENNIQVDTATVNRLQQEGKTLSIVWKGNEPIGYLAARDEVREHSKEAIEKLRQLGINSVMLTGDNRQTAQAIAKAAGIDQFFSNLSPSEKVKFIEEYKTKDHIVGMVGDGINDAPALAAADVGIAMGAGTDVAMETASIGLLKNDLMSVVDAIRLSRKAFVKIKQNLFFAFIYNILGIPLAAMGFLNPIIAAAAMAMSSLSVVMNALSLNRWR